MLSQTYLPFALGLITIKNVLNYLDVCPVIGIEIIAKITV